MIIISNGMASSAVVYSMIMPNLFLLRGILKLKKDVARKRYYIYFT